MADSGAAGGPGERGADAVGHGRWVGEVAPGDPAVLDGLRSVGIGSCRLGEWLFGGRLEFLAPEGKTRFELDHCAFVGEPQSFGCGDLGINRLGVRRW